MLQSVFKGPIDRETRKRHPMIVSIFFFHSRKTSGDSKNSSTNGSLYLLLGVVLISTAEKMSLIGYTLEAASDKKYKHYIITVLTH
jgi:hypothetical protein